MIFNSNQANMRQNPVKIAPSILAANFACLGQQVAEAERWIRRKKPNNYETKNNAQIAHWSFLQKTQAEGSHARRARTDARTNQRTTVAASPLVD